jgi:hypothetical protein
MLPLKLYQLNGFEVEFANLCSLTPVFQYLLITDWVVPVGSSAIHEHYTFSAFNFVNETENRFNRF